MNIEIESNGLAYVATATEEQVAELVARDFVSLTPEKWGCTTLLGLCFLTTTRNGKLFRTRPYNDDRMPVFVAIENHELVLEPEAAQIANDAVFAAKNSALTGTGEDAEWIFDCYRVMDHNFLCDKYGFENDVQYHCHTVFVEGNSGTYGIAYDLETRETVRDDRPWQMKLMGL